MLRCLFVLTGIVAPICAFAQSDPLIVFLPPSPLQPSAVISKMQDEVSMVLRTAGVAVEFRQLDQRQAGESYDQFVVVKWNGVCDSDDVPASGRNKDRLAFAHVSSGRVMPFVEVECGNINAMLSAWTRGENAWQRNQMMGRALGRLVAHEVYHFLTQRRGHDQNGVSKAAFQKRDLIADSFVFEEHTRAQMQRPVPTPADESLEEGTGR